VLPRVKPGSAVVHLVNWDYDDARDGVRPATETRLKLDLAALGVAGATEAILHAPGMQARKLPVERGNVTVPELGLWAVLELKDRPAGPR
jgi:hypothetical protein